ncbi:TPA: OmpA family lipoprotein [Salmonella enterica]|nr:glycine zipper 2TM domain-containing protein [Salmonella enterica subsp. indica serovar 11:b:e,n,x]HBC0141814.1 OmpA family lipoprotein [Salmonella enterica subsp. indica serovar 11:b:e,n,x]HBC0163294.1 OmpA family lipoprotein [Salmonella enterica subsp. indica]HCL5296076.1 OmpA family lipoprotein [Salmonella enterica]
MKKRVFVIAAIVSGALAVSGCTTNPYTGEREAGKSGIGAGIGSLVGAGIGALSSSKKDRGKGALIGAAAGAALGGGVGYYMDVQEAKLRDKMRGTGVSVTRSGDNIILNMPNDNIILNMPNNVTFDSSSATLKPAGANTLTGVAMVLKEYPKTAVNVVGYTDSTGSHDLNMRLSQQRADSVASSLITQGVDASRIRTSGMGPANPIASNSTPEGKAQNRRVEITLSPLQ